MVLKMAVVGGSRLEKHRVSGKKIALMINLEYTNGTHR